MAAQPIIIVGMHRSGTSLVSRTLQQCGIELGADQEKNNESRFFLNINRWVLAQCGGRWDTPEPVAQLLTNPELSGLFVTSMQVMLESHRRKGYFGRSSESSFDALQRPWGWKDPRNSVTLPLWLGLFPKARIINITRHGVDVAHSLYTRNTRIIDNHLPVTQRDIIRYVGRKKRIVKPRDGLSIRCSTLDGALGLWRSYMDFSASSLSNVANALTLKYEDFLASPKTFLEELLDFCEISVPPAKVIEGLETLNADRAFAFRLDDELLKFAQQHKDILSAHGY
jgi:hypothetical protein